MHGEELIVFPIFCRGWGVERRVGADSNKSKKSVVFFIYSCSMGQTPIIHYLGLARAFSHPLGINEPIMEGNTPKSSISYVDQERPEGINTAEIM